MKRREDTLRHWQLRGSALEGERQQLLKGLSLGWPEQCIAHALTTAQHGVCQLPHKDKRVGAATLTCMTQCMQ